MRVRPFQLVGDAQLARLRERANQAIDQWMRAWGVEPAGFPSVDVAPAPFAGASLQAADDWRRHWSGEVGAAWCDWTPDLVAQVKKLVFPPDAGDVGNAGLDALAREGAASAFDELVDSLRCLFVDEAADAGLLRPLDADIWRHGSGAACVSIAFGPELLRLVMDGAGVRRAVAMAVAPMLPRLPSVKLRQAIDQTPVTLTLSAGQVELGAGTLLTVGVGDVIALRLGLDSPMSLRLDGREVCKGFIGRQGDRLAVELSRK